MTKRLLTCFVNGQPRFSSFTIMKEEEADLNADINFMRSYMATIDEPYTLQIEMGDMVDVTRTLTPDRVN